LIIHQNGNVSINNTNNSFQFDVNGTGRFAGSVNSSFIGATLSNTSTGTGARNVLQFTNSIAGNGLIELFGGGYTPSGGGDDVADGFRIFSNGSGGMAIRANTGTLRFYTGSTERLTIASTTGAATFSSSVTATAFFESSSIAGKNIIKTNPLTSLDLDVIQYTRKTDESKDVRYGYSAEQIHSLMPELTDKDVTAVKYLDVHTLLIAQLQQEIKELKAKFN
jgi:hypothetical protein